SQVLFCSASHSNRLFPSRRRHTVSLGSSSEPLSDSPSRYWRWFRAVRSSIEVTLDRGILVALRLSTGCFQAVGGLKPATAPSNERGSWPQVEFSFTAAWQRYRALWASRA